MTRYVARPLSARDDQRKPRGHEYDDWDAGNRIPTVDYDPRAPQFSGLYDPNGNPLYRLPDKLGF